jgi:aspartyl-tRNA(Asn)/glutamyl-tRNA(Gln) amidotransferase subunit A
LISRTEAKQIHAEAVRTHLAELGADVAAALASPLPEVSDLLDAFRLRRQAIEIQRQVLTRVDVVVTPTTPVPATRIGQGTVILGGVEEALSPAMMRCVSPFNMSQLPALSVPCGFTRAGLPIGLQIAGRPFDEATVLRVGHGYEQATAWHLLRPSLPGPARL